MTSNDEASNDTLARPTSHWARGDRGGVSDVRVLVVDDEPMMRRAFEAALAQAGYEVLTSATGGEALELAAREHPHVVLLDQHLPDLGGHEVLARLRSDPTTADAVVLMVSGDDSVNRRLEGLEGGASDYLTKPVDLREVLARIEVQLASRERWLGRLDSSMSARMRLATTLVSLSGRTAALPDLLAELGRRFDVELDVAGVALRTRHGGHLAPPVTQSDSRGALGIALSAEAALDSPWLQRAAGLVVVHLPLQTASETFAVLSVEPRTGAEQLLATLVDLAPQLSALLLPAVDAAVSTRTGRARVKRLLQPDGMWPVFQPIVDLSDRRVVGCEGLTRFVDGTRPDLGFALAGRVGMRPILELEAIRRVLHAAQRLPEDVWVSVNVSAATLLGADLGPLVSGMSHRLVLEITEHELVTDYTAILDAVAGLGEVRIAVDDAGSGYASLRHIYELRPDIIKLDRGWVAGIDRDPVRQAMIAGLNTFSLATGARLVGEGIERDEEAVTLASLGVPWGQGFLFADPDVLDHPSGPGADSTPPGSPSQIDVVQQRTADAGTVEFDPRARDLLASEEQAASTDEFCRLLLDSAGEGVYGIDREGRCTFINTEGLRLLGFDHDTQVLGADMHALVHHTREDGSPYPVAECTIFAAHREGRGLVRDDEVLFRPDGSSFPAEYRSYPIIRDGYIEGSVLTFTDITERRQTETELARSRSLQRMAGEVAGLGGWSLDVARQEVTWSEELYEIFDHPRGVQPRDLASLGRYLSPDRDRIEHAVEQCAVAGAPFDLEARIEIAEARQVWVRIIGGPRYGPDGTVTHVDGAVQDIDELKTSTQRAEQLSERLTKTLENITDAFWTVDGDWRMTYINRRAEQLLCRNHGELLGADLWESFPEAVGSVLDEVYHRVMRTGLSEVIEEFHWPPLDVWLDIHVYASDQGIAVYFRDVSDQRKTRLELRERENRVAEQAALLDKARDAIIVRDLDHRVTYWNDSAQRLHGYSAEEALGHPLRELVGHDDDRSNQAMTTLLEQDEWVGDLDYVASDGSVFVTEAHWTLLRDDDGQPTSVLSIESDVTERRRIERQLLRTQRLESLGTLATGIAHDLNNVLAPILLTSQAMQLARPDQRAAGMLSIIEQSARQGQDMVRQVVAFASGGGDGEHNEVALEEIVDQTTKILRETFPRNIEVHCEITESVPPVLGDPTQVQQVLMNLCVNARDAMPDGGHLRIGLEVTTVTDDAIAHECPPGRYASIRVEDTGIGMDPQTQGHVFDPFYTTKPQGQGTGLGLSTSHGIVRRHDGFIQLCSQPGTGSTFIVHLPVASG